MKYSLLRMTQLILSAMDSDEINSIDDSVEAQQVVDVIETTFNDLLTSPSFPEQWDFFQLDPSGDTTRPTLMYIPDEVEKFEWINYNRAEAADTDRNYAQVRYMPIYEFMNRMNTLDTVDADTYQFNYMSDGKSYDVRGYNNDFPAYYTVIGDSTLLFDNFREDISLTLTAARTQGWGRIIPTFSRTDSWVPPIDAQSFSLFFNEAKSQAFIELKQVQNAKADQRARQAKIESQIDKHRTPQPAFRDTNAEDFGRRGGGGYKRILGR